MTTLIKLLKSRKNIRRLRCDNMMIILRPPIYQIYIKFLFKPDRFNSIINQSQMKKMFHCINVVLLLKLTNYTYFVKPSIFVTFNSFQYR